MDDPKILLDSIDKIHTTELGTVRIRKNLNLETEDVVEFCKKMILHPNCKRRKRGKNWYCELGRIRITVNASSDTIITAHMEKQ